MHSAVVLDAEALRRLAARQSALAERVADLAVAQENWACTLSALREAAAHDDGDSAVRSAPCQTLVSRIDALVSETDDLRDEVLDLGDELSECAEEVLALFDASRPVETAAVEAPQVTSSSRRLDADEYRSLIDRLRHVIEHALPADADVLVVSRGDDELLRLGSRRAAHFPQGERGFYAGHYPADSAAAVEHLESLRSSGAQFLVFPQTALWWLDHYKEFRRHLETRYRVIANDPVTCLIFGLVESTEPGGAVAEAVGTVRYRAVVGQVRDVVRRLLPSTATVIVVSHGDCELLQLDGRRAWHFPQAADGSHAAYAPRDGAQAIALLEALREAGGEYLLFPRTDFWWLEYYRELREYLERQCRLVVRQQHVCWIYALASSRSASVATTIAGNTGRGKPAPPKMHEVI
jgi:hypothetical protein